MERKLKLGNRICLEYHAWGLKHSQGKDMKGGYRQHIRPCIVYLVRKVILF